MSDMSRMSEFLIKCRTCHVWLVKRPLSVTTIPNFELMLKRRVLNL